MPVHVIMCESLTTGSMIDPEEMGENMKKLVTLATVAAMVCSTGIAFASETDLGVQTRDSNAGNASNVATEYKSSTPQSGQTTQPPKENAVQAPKETTVENPHDTAVSGDSEKERQEAWQEARAKTLAKEVDRKIKAIKKVKLNDKKKIARARNAYKRLDDRAKKYVKRATRLKRAEKRWKKLYKRYLKELRFKKGMAKYIRLKNHGLSKKTAFRYAGYFMKYGKKYDVDPKALMAIACHESRFSAGAYNAAGYYGMMQTSAAIGRNAGFSTTELFRAKNSIKAAAKLYSYNLNVFRGSHYMAFAGYCAGTYGAKSGHYNASIVGVRAVTRNNIKVYMKKHGYM